MYITSVEVLSMKSIKLRLLCQQKEIDFRGLKVCTRHEFNRIILLMVV